MVLLYTLTSDPNGRYEDRPFQCCYICILLVQAVPRTTIKLSKDTELYVLLVPPQAAAATLLRSAVVKPRSTSVCGRPVSHLKGGLEGLPWQGVPLLRSSPPVTTTFSGHVVEVCTWLSRRSAATRYHAPKQHTPPQYIFLKRVISPGAQATKMPRLHTRAARFIATASLSSMVQWLSSPFLFQSACGQ